MKIGAQIYSMRSIINNANELERAFDYLAKHKAQAVEMVDFPFADSAMLARLSREYGVEIGSTHSNYNRMINDTERLIEEHLEYNSHIVGLGSMPLNKYNVKSRSSILKFCDDISHVAHKASRYGVTIDYHNHAYEFKRIGGERVIDMIINNTPDNVKLCLDIYWTHAAGVPVEKFMVDNASKINIIHFKDYIKKFIGSKYGALGDGRLDIKRIYDIAVSQGVKYGYVEHDNPGNPQQVIAQGLSLLDSFISKGR